MPARRMSPGAARATMNLPAKAGANNNNHQWKEDVIMPVNLPTAGGWVLALSLTLTGCKTGTENPGGETDALLEPGENEGLLYYKRPDADYAGWGLHLWNDAASGCDGLAEDVPTSWEEPRLPDGISDTYGAYFFIPMRDAGNCLTFIMHKGDEKDLGDRKSTRLNSSHVRISYA